MSVALAFFALTSVFSGVVFAQQATYPVTIHVKDGVTGTTAQGVTTIIQSSSGAVVQNLGVVGDQGSQISLAPGSYSAIVQIGIFGIPFTLQSLPFTISQATSVDVTVSALIPVQYLPIIVYIIVAIIVIVILYIIIRRLMKSR